MQDPAWEPTKKLSTLLRFILLDEFTGSYPGSIKGYPRGLCVDHTHRREAAGARSGNAKEENSPALEVGFCSCRHPELGWDEDGKEEEQLHLLQKASRTGELQCLVASECAGYP